MPNETQLIQEFALQWNEAMRKPMLHKVTVPIKCPPRFERMPLECYAANMPGITEVPCSLH